MRETVSNSIRMLAVAGMAATAYGVLKYIDTDEARPHIAVTDVSAPEVEMNPEQAASFTARAKSLAKAISSQMQDDLENTPRETRNATIRAGYSDGVFYRQKRLEGGRIIEWNLDAAQSNMYAGRLILTFIPRSVNRTGGFIFENEHVELTSTSEVAVQNFLDLADTALVEVWKKEAIYRTDCKLSDEVVAVCAQRDDDGRLLAVADETVFANGLVDHLVDDFQLPRKS